MSGLMPGSGGSLMPRATVPTQSTPAGGFVDDLFFETDDQDYIGFDSDNSVNGRPREIRFTRLLVSDYAHAIGTSPAETNGFILRNSTAAAAGAQQYSPSIFLAGQGWETTGSSSDEVIFRMETQPVQGASVSGNLMISTSLNGGAYSNLLRVNSSGALRMMASSGADILWNTDGGGDIGASGANRPADIYLSGTVTGSTAVFSSQIQVPGLFSSASDGFAIQNLNISTGLGTTVHLRAYGATQAGRPVILTHSSRTDGANNIVIASNFDRNAASITNADTMRLHSFGWTNNSDAYTELFAVVTNGTVLFGTAQDADSAPTGIAAGQLAYFSNGDAGSPCLGVYTGASWLRIALGAAVASS